MGRTYLFECSKCGYTARVAGRADEGRDFSIQTISCHNCKKLYDSVTRLRVAPDAKDSVEVPVPRKRAFEQLVEPPPAFGVVLNRMPVSELRRSKWTQFNLTCPVSTVHKVQSWNHPGKCPLCGVFLERSPLPFRHWE
jgi:hypothetical protein